jgi:hypothetical protein
MPAGKTRALEELRAEFGLQLLDRDAEGRLRDP